MEKKSFYGMLLAAVLVSTGLCDTFKHKETGESFSGFMTQKTTGGATRVYNSTDKKFVNINLSEYETTFNAEGRRENVVVVAITEPETLQSQTVAEYIAKAIVEASNAGPLAIVVQIDNPGGRGEYMKIITTAITQTANCPVVAYVSGGPYGGAFNASAVIALACDKLFIAPTAAIGAVGPFVSSSRSTEDYQSFLAAYAPDTLVTYSTYVSALAQENNRPQTLARGLIDKSLSIVEVRNPDGSADFIIRDDRQPNQTVVQTLAEGMTAKPTGQRSENETVAAANIAGTVLNLTAADAVKAGLADQIVASRQEVLAAMKLPNAQATPAQGIDNIVKKFVAAKRNIGEGLAQINALEADAKRLDENLIKVQQQVQTGTQTREVVLGSRRDETAYEDDVNTRYSSYRYDDTRTTRSPYLRSGQKLTSVEPGANPEVIRQQLTGVLRQVISEYRRVINVAERWPGALPNEMPLSTLEQNWRSASAQLDSLYTLDTNIPNRNIVNQPVRRGY